MSTLIEERRAAQSLLGLMCLEAREGPLNAPPAASSLLPGCFVPPLSNPRGSVLRTVGPSFDPTHAALVQDPRSNLAAPTPVGQLMPDPASSGYEGSLLEGLRLGDFGGRVGLLPGLRPKFMEQYAVSLGFNAISPHRIYSLHHRKTHAAAQRAGGAEAACAPGGPDRVHTACQTHTASTKPRVLPLSTSTSVRSPKQRKR